MDCSDSDGDEDDGMVMDGQDLDNPNRKLEDGFDFDDDQASLNLRDSDEETETDSVMMVGNCWTEIQNCVIFFRSVIETKLVLLLRWTQYIIESMNELTELCSIPCDHSCSSHLFVQQFPAVTCSSHLCYRVKCC